MKMWKNYINLCATEINITIVYSINDTSTMTGTTPNGNMILYGAILHMHMFKNVPLRLFFVKNTHDGLELSSFFFFHRERGRGLYLNLVGLLWVKQIFVMLSSHDTKKDVGESNADLFFLKTKLNSSMKSLWLSSIIYTV